MSADAAGIASQSRIDAMSDETSSMAAQYRQLMSEADSIERYTRALASQVESQQQKLTSTQRQLDEIVRTQRDVLPLLESMVATLADFVAVDVPFLLEERTERVESLRAMLPRADVSVSEKYRRVLEAYQIEAEYGRTVDAYSGTLPGPAGNRTVDFVRVGRVSLAYRTSDGSESGYFDADTREWRAEASIDSEVARALRIARKQGAPDLIMIPVRAPREISQ